MIQLKNRFLGTLVVIVLLASSIQEASAFAMSAKEIYDIPNSGWTAKEWNWGSAMGTGHDCALICRRQYGSRSSRAQLVEELLNGQGPSSFEEVKLILGLAWQRGRWDGSDGGPGGYGDVLSEMAKATRYEVGDDCDQLLVQDMQERYQLLDPTSADIGAMESVLEDNESLDVARRKCSGLVLKSMNFVDNGL